MLSNSENTRRKKCNFRRLFYSVTRDKPFVLWYIPASRFRAPAQPAEKPSPRRCSSQPSTSWKDGRVVDCTALERRHTEIPYRGFESLSFRQDFLYRRRFKATVLHGHKIGHQKPKKPPDLDSSGSGFFVNSKFANVRQSLAASRCVSLAASAYSSGLRQKVLFAPRRAYFA